MLLKLGAVADVVTMVAQVRDLDVLGVNLGTRSVAVGDECRLVPSVEVHADTHAGARSLAGRWGLDEEPSRLTDPGIGVGIVVWRTWSGLIPEGSLIRCVHLMVTAAEQQGADPVHDPVRDGGTWPEPVRAGVAW